MSTIQLEQKGNYVIIRLNRGKANPMNNQMLLELIQALKDIEANPEQRGAILTGNTPGYFSVGLDLKEIFYYDEKQITEFWENFSGIISQMTRFPKPLFAAINGHSPAGGCVFTICCDYRVMANNDNIKIGLNEVAVGIVVPEYIYHLYSFWIGSRKAYHNLMKGVLMNPQEALEINLVDEIAPIDEVLSRTEAQMKRWLRYPDSLINPSKMNMRRTLLAAIDSAPEVSVEERLEAWFDPKSRAVMKMLVDSLSK